MKEIQENWDKMSRAYEDFTCGVDSYSYAIEWPCINGLLPDLYNKKILDLGCGTGRFSFLFEEKRPSFILGIDISEKMLDIAKEKADRIKSKVNFVNGDMSHVKEITNQKFDFIFSSTTLHYIEDLDNMFSQISTLLENDGVCIISVMHPVYTAQYPVMKNGVFPSDEEWSVRYLDKRKRAYIQPWIEYNNAIDNYLSTSYHHTISDYFNAVIHANLKVERVEEPYPPEAWKQEFFNRYDAFIETPSYMILKLTKH